MFVALLKKPTIKIAIKYKIIRLCNVYGTGDINCSAKKNALQYLTNEVVSNRNINLYSGGENIRDFLHVDDVCNAIDLCISKSDYNDIINVGSGIPYKFKDFNFYPLKRISQRILWETN